MKDFMDCKKENDKEEIGQAKRVQESDLEHEVETVIGVAAGLVVVFNPLAAPAVAAAVGCAAR